MGFNVEKEFKKSLNFFKLAAILKVPQKLLKNMSDWAVSYYCQEIIKSLSKYNDTTHLTPQTMKNIKETIFWCKKHIQGQAPKEQVFTIDLLELPYFDIIDRNKFEKNTAPFIAGIFMTTPEEKKKAPHSKVDWGGLFYNDIYLYRKIPEYITVRELDAQINSLKETIRHELQHMVQTHLQNAKGLKDLGGLPSEKIREKGADPFGNPMQGNKKETIYELHDIEFYTNLNDSIERFKLLVNKFPFKTHQKLFDTWIGKDGVEDFFGGLYELTENNLKIDELYRDYFAYISAAYKFFFALKVKNSGKYMKAVKEFYKEVAYLL